MIGSFDLGYKFSPSLLVFYSSFFGECIKSIKMLYYAYEIITVVSFVRNNEYGAILWNSIFLFCRTKGKISKGIFQLDGI